VVGKTGLFGLALLCASFLLPAPVQAGYFMLMDQNGDVSFTDTRPNQSSRLVVVKYVYNNSKSYVGKPGSYRFSRAYDHIITAAAHRNSLDPMLVKSVIKVESDFNRFTTSSKGARGLMQLMPNTARNLGVTNSFDATQNINGGAKYLRKMLKRFDGNTKLALAAYNAGPTAVETYGGVPPYKETMRYITKVMKAYTSLTGHRYPLAANQRSFAKSKKAAKLYKSITADGVLVFSDKPIQGNRIVED